MGRQLQAAERRHARGLLLARHHVRAFFPCFLAHAPAALADTPFCPLCGQVPLILGIWGGKGQGKTFQCALAYKKVRLGRAGRV